MLKPADTEIVVLKGPLPTPLHLSAAVGHPPTVRAVTGLSACAGLGGKHSQIVYTGVACSPAPGENLVATCQRIQADILVYSHARQNANGSPQFKCRCFR